MTTRLLGFAIAVIVLGITTALRADPTVSESWEKRAKNYKRAMYFRELIGIALPDSLLLAYKVNEWTNEELREHLAAQLEGMSVHALMVGERLIEIG